MIRVEASKQNAAYLVPQISSTCQ